MFYTKNGRPLQLNGNLLYSRSGIAIGKIMGDKAFGPDGRYVGTIEKDRLIFRSIDSASIAPPFSIANIVGIALGDAVGSSLWGDEPNTPD